MLPQLAGLFTLILNLLCLIKSQGELYLDDLIKYGFNTGFCLDIYEQISFKLGMMKDATEMYRFSPI